MYQLISIILIIVSIQLSHFFLAIYVLVAYIYFTIYNPTLMSTSDKNIWVPSGLVSKFKTKFLEFFNVFSFYFKEYVYILIFISLLLSIFREAYFITFYLILFMVGSYAKLLELPKSITKKIEVFKDDNIVIQTHRIQDGLP